MPGLFLFRRNFRASSALVGTSAPSSAAGCFSLSSTTHAFDLTATDEFFHDEPSNVVGSFNRVSCGGNPVDHHALNCYESKFAGLQHISYEVQDVDDLFVGFNHLRRLGKYEHMQGVGYHPPGGQVYDYWLTPWGQMHEHWISTRKFTADSRYNLLPAPKEHDPESRFNNQVMSNAAA